MPNASGCRLYLIRHGETANAARKCFNGHFDVALSPNGENQMAEVAKALASKPIRMVYSSDLQRTRAGARLIAGPHGLEPVAYPELKEMHFGKWEGLGIDEIDQQYPGELAAYFKSIATVRVDGGETIREVHERSIPVVERLAQRHSNGESIAVVAHGGVNRVILCHYLGIPWERLDRISQGFSAVNIIQFYPEMPVVELINGTTANLA